jgi:ketosteroid isomerase-like protein
LPLYLAPTLTAPNLIFPFFTLPLMPYLPCGLERVMLPWGPFEARQVRGRWPSPSDLFARRMRVGANLPAGLEVSSVFH